MAEQVYPLDELLAMRQPQKLCEWHALADVLGACGQTPSYRCVLTGPDEVGDLCSAHIIDIAIWVNQYAGELPELGTVIAMPLGAAVLAGESGRG